MVNHQKDSDSIPSLNTEIDCHELTRMKYFDKIYINSADKQIEIYEKFTEISFMNTDRLTEVDSSNVSHKDFE